MFENDLEFQIHGIHSILKAYSIKIIKYAWKQYGFSFDALKLLWLTWRRGNSKPKVLLHQQRELYVCVCVCIFRVVARK